MQWVKNMKNKTLAYFCAVLYSVCITLFIIVAALEFCSYDKAFFNKQYKSYNAAQSIGISETDLSLVTSTLIDYLKGDLPTLDVEVERNGTTQQFFNQREKDHMVDVVVLFDLARTVKWVSFVIALACGIFLHVVHKKQAFRILGKTYLITVGAIITVGCVLAFIISRNFDAAWTLFHTLVFTNDLWLLDPNTDMLINLVPLPFFMAITTRLAIILACSLTVIGGLSVFALVKNKNETVKGGVSK